MRKMKILVTNAADLKSYEIEQISSLGYEIHYVENDNKVLDLDFTLYEGVICNSLFLYNQIEMFSNLKFIQLSSVGLDRVPLNYIKENGISLYNAGASYSVPMAEWVITKIFETYKKSRILYENQVMQIWKKEREIEELVGKTVAIIGYGNVGYEISKRLSAFDMEIIAVDIDIKENEYINSFYHITELTKVLTISDIVVLTLPLTDETKYIIDNKTLCFFKKNAVLINVSRGKLINEEDLLGHIDKGNFFGVALDTFEEEPLLNNKIWENKKILVSPHNSFVSTSNHKRLFNVIFENLKKVRDFYG